MNEKIMNLIDKLETMHSLDTEEYAYLVAGRDDDAAEVLAHNAVSIRKKIYGNAVFVRGLIEISNVCKNNCLYCGIRRSNSSCSRYRLTQEQILGCCQEGYDLGFRTFVLQGGEDPALTDEIICGIGRQIKMNFPDCAVTLSLGEKLRESYQSLFDAGADRYLLRHETANPQHYEKLHPSDMSYFNRMSCLGNLKEIGYQVGCGFMVGSPWQTPDCIAEDLKFIEQFQPAMCGIGPFIPHGATPFKNQAAGTLEMTTYLLSIIRLISPGILLPATTALGTIHPTGREQGILAGANVVMPNLSPVNVRSKYELYDHKICTGEESAECRNCLNNRMQAIGYEIITDRGDPRPYG